MKRSVLIAAFAALTTIMAFSSPVFADFPDDLTAVLDVNTTDFPASSIVNFNFVRKHPTGILGELFVGTDGRFYFEDGTRARFWGINIAKGSVFMPKPVIDQAIAVIDRAGFNMVRFHHIDDVEGLLPRPTDGIIDRIDPDKLDLLDYWIAELGKRGIYVYMDLLDYRTFYEAEGVRRGEELGRGAKPYAVFDRRLIGLQQQYARKLLIDHINPYTGLSYAQDPTVCMVELFDENGLFITARRWNEMLSPYREELQQSYNEWLLRKYSDTATLREAWTDITGMQGLLADESLEQGTVRLFPPPRSGSFPAPTIERNLGPEDGQVGRVTDRRLFFAKVHRDYFRSMREYLRNHGMNKPISAVSDVRHLSDLHSVVQELDFVGSNFYYDHPSWSAGNEWRLPSFFENSNPLADERTETLVPRMCANRVFGKPLVLREWNHCWPNKFRGTGILEAAVYGALQDIDAMLLFTYDIRPGARNLGYFDVSSDPQRWGLASIGASIFLRRQVSPAQRKIAVGHSEVDTHYPAGEPLPSELYKAGWVSQMGNLFFDREAPPFRGLTVASGRAGGAAYPGRRSIIFNNINAMDLLNHRTDTATDQLSGYDIATIPETTQSFHFGGTMYGASERRNLNLAQGYLLADIQQHENLRPIGIGSDNESVFGFRDMSRGNYVFRRLSPMHQLRVTLDAIGQLFGDAVSHEFVNSKTFVSDTGQVRRNINGELLIVDAPSVHAVSGALSNPSLTRTSGMTVNTSAPLGTVVWLSVDNRSVSRSQYWMLKMLTLATNTDEQKQLHHTSRERTIFSLLAPGRAPVLTGGAPAQRPTVVSLDGKEVVRAFIENGTWEVVGEGRSYYLFCDTPGVRFHFPELGDRVKMTAFAGELEKPAEVVSQPIEYPSGILMVRISR